MEPMMKIINALAALTAALQEFTAQTTEGYINTFEEILILSIILDTILKKLKAEPE